MELMKTQKLIKRIKTTLNLLLRNKMKLIEKNEIGRQKMLKNRKQTKIARTCLNVIRIETKSASVRRKRKREWRATHTAPAVSSRSHLLLS